MSGFQTFILGIPAGCVEQLTFIFCEGIEDFLSSHVVSPFGVGGGVFFFVSI
jgi:hypothetical protein